MDFNNSPLQNLDLSYYGIKNQVYVKRDDLIHPIISGNKWRKLKYNLKYFNSISKKGIISIGGAYSSHILALSYICKVYSIKCVLLVRGEQPSPLNDILMKCQSYGAIIEYINRNDYKNPKWIKNFYKEKYNDFFFIPEGGANFYGIKGCQKIVKEIENYFDYIFCDVGTGTTFSGIVSSLKKSQSCFGIVVLKGANTIGENISKKFESELKKPFSKNWILNHNYHFGGYAKYSEELILFMREFYKITGLITDPIYSGKMFYGLVDQLKKTRNWRIKKLLLYILVGYPE